MLARIRKAQENEGGFTLIELLVVIIIIGILAAIAIPTFLSQREKGYRADAKSTMKNAATAAESYATELGGNYSLLSVTLMTGEGFKNPASTKQVVKAKGSTTAYCINVNDVRLGATDSVDYWYASDIGTPTTDAQGVCAGGGALVPVA